MHAPGFVGIVDPVRDRPGIVGKVRDLQNRETVVQHSLHRDRAKIGGKAVPLEWPTVGFGTSRSSPKD